MKDFNAPITNAGGFFSVSPARQPVGVGNGLKPPRKIKTPAAPKARASRTRPSNAGNQNSRKYT
jgi:hypothetical protein